MSGVRVLAELDELISNAEELQDYCSETGPNEAMRLASTLRAIRASVETTTRREEIRRVELHATRVSYERLIRTLSAIHIRCAPADFTTENGKVMRFVPPDPEFYWRQLSASIKAIESEMHATFAEEDAALTTTPEPN